MSEPSAAILPVILEAKIDLHPPHWLSGAPWRWEVRGVRGEILADGEGCRTAGVAIEVARLAAYDEGWLTPPTRPADASPASPGTIATPMD